MIKRTVFALLVALSSVLAAPIAALSEITVRIVPSRDVYMIDGDTAKIDKISYRLVGFDTPETYEPQCDYEKALGDQATRRARELVDRAGAVELVVLPGLDYHKRNLARMYVEGRDLGTILISEGLAREYLKGRRQSWCN